MEPSLPTCPSLAEMLVVRHDELADHLVPRLEPLPGQQDAERRQFIAAFVQLLGQAARGDMSLRDEYLATIIPGCKSAGIELGYMLSVLVHIFMEVMAIASEGDQRAFLTAFARDYTKRLLATWEQS